MYLHNTTWFQVPLNIKERTIDFHTAGKRQHLTWNRLTWLYIHLHALVRPTIVPVCLLTDKINCSWGKFFNLLIVTLTFIVQLGSVLFKAFQSHLVTNTVQEFLKCWPCTFCDRKKKLLNAFKPISHFWGTWVLVIILNIHWNLKYMKYVSETPCPCKCHTGSQGQCQGHNVVKVDVIHSAWLKQYAHQTLTLLCTGWMLQIKLENAAKWKDRQTNGQDLNNMSLTAWSMGIRMWTMQKVVPENINHYVRLLNVIYRQVCFFFFVCFVPQKKIWELKFHQSVSLSCLAPFEVRKHEKLPQRVLVILKNRA